MSRKTDEIRKSIRRLEEIQEELYSDGSENSISLSDRMKSELQNLKLWIDMLYKYNGTSKSRAKVTASRENGKKGGRPPKFISDLKKQKNELEEIISELHQKEISSSIDEEAEIKLQTEKAYEQLREVEEKLAEAETKRRS